MRDWQQKGAMYVSTLGLRTSLRNFTHKIVRNIPREKSVGKKKMEKTYNQKEGQKLG